MKEVISVLFIEDSEDSNQDIKDVLQASHFSVVQYTEQQADNLPVLLDAHKWDLIIADYDKHAFDLNKAMKIIAKQDQEPPLILIGSDLPKSSLHEAIMNGVQDYVEKNNLDRLIPVVTREVRNHKKQRRYLESVSKFQTFGSILEKSTNEVFLLDPMSLKIIYANETLLQNLGYTEDELYDLPLKQLIARDHISHVYESISPLYRGKKKTINLQFKQRRKDGSAYPVSMHLEITNEINTQVIMGISFDMSRQIKDAEIIRTQKRKARELQKNIEYKTKFYADLSHEMRTMLNSSLLLTRILKENRENNLSTEQLDFVDAIFNSNNSVLELLNEILDLSKIESGNVRVNLEPVKLDELCRRMSRLFSPIAKEKDLSFECSVNGMAAKAIRTDKLRLEQVLNNLISNALKFTEQGHVKLSIFEPSEDQKKQLSLNSQNFVAFNVVDTGIGIPENKQKQIFKSYVQAKGAETENKYGGTGLGLAISKEIAQILGGKITLSSTPGAGSTFTLFLPADSTGFVKSHAKVGKVINSHEREELPLKTRNTTVSATKGKVLLVDDSSLHNLALKEFLGYQVEQCLTAETASDAYDILDNHSIDCIVLDMYLPDADGKEVLQHLKMTQTYKDIPVIIYSGKSLSASEDEELRKQAHSIVQKNANSYKVLLEIVLDLLSDP